MKPFMACLMTLSVLSLALWILNRRPKSLLDRRLTRKSAEEYAAEIAQGQKAEKKNKVRMPMLDRFEKEAKKVGLNVSGQAFFLIMLGACVSLYVATYTITRQPLMGLVAALLGIYAPRIYLNAQAQKRYSAFMRHFDGALLLAASGLRAGMSVQQAFEEVAEKARSVIAQEFARVVNAIRLGATPGDALNILPERVPGAEIQMFVVATQSLMKTGGNLPDVYTQTAGMIVEQREFRESMKASTAEGRMTAWVITLMPVGLLGFVSIANPNYFDPFLQLSGGRMVLLACAAAYGVGWLAIKRLLEVQVD